MSDARSGLNRAKPSLATNEKRPLRTENRELRTENWELKENSPQAFQPAGCPVDCLGLTEVVTLVAPSSLRCPAQPVPGGSAHIHG